MAIEMIGAEQDLATCPAVAPERRALLSHGDDGSTSQVETQCVQLQPVPGEVPPPDCELLTLRSPSRRKCSPVPVEPLV